MPMWDSETYDKTDRAFVLYKVTKGEERPESKVHKAAMPFVRMAAYTEFMKKFVPEAANEAIKGLFELDNFSSDWKYPVGFVTSQPKQMVDPQIAHGMQFTVYHPGGVYHLTATTYDAGTGKAVSIKSKFFVEVWFPAEAIDVDFDVKRNAIINTWAKANVRFESVEPKKDPAQKMPLKSDWHAHLSLYQNSWDVSKVRDCRKIELPDGTQGTCTLAKSLIDEMYICGKCFAPRRSRDGACEDGCDKKRSIGGSSSRNMDFDGVFKRLNSGKNPRTY